LRQQLGERHLRDALHVGIVYQHAHAERLRHARQLAADRAVADDANRAAAQLAARVRRGHAARAVLGTRVRYAAREVHHEAQHQLAHGRDETRACLRDEHPCPARRDDIHIADIHGAAQKGHQLRQALEQRGGSRRLAVGDDEVAVRGGGDQRLALQRDVSRVQLHFAQGAQAGERALAVILREGLGRVGEQDSGHGGKLW
jgi:hypothetical protein